jgi:tRNA (adenine22-N1)-methyltransferase
MSEKQINISDRLKMLAGMVTPGNRVADIGCDHGFLPIYLYRTGRIASALAMDVRPGPLGAAKEHIAQNGLEEYISVRLSDGLKEYHEGEADTIVCAGMGGRLMERIMRESMDKARSVDELILQPQSEIGEFRAFLREQGFLITDEDAVCEDGKYYFAMRAVPDGKAGAESACGGDRLPDETSKLYDSFGEKLLTARHPVLYEFLRQRLKVIRGVESKLLSPQNDRQRERLAEIDRERKMLERALVRFYEL